VPTAILRAVAKAETAQAEAKLTTLGKKINAIGTAGGKKMSAFGVAARLGFAAAGVAALAFAAKSVKSYQEHQVAINQLQNVLKNSPKLASATTAEFEKQATALQKLTGFQDEEILAADTVLARFNLTAKQLHEVTPLVLDYARATGKDANEAAGLIGRALLGNARALKLVGINFKATGDTAKDTAKIMDLLRGKVGGTAEAFGKTAVGKVAILKAEFDDFQEVVGKLVTDALVPVIGFMNKFLGVINVLPGPIRAGVVITVGLTGAFVGLGLALRVLRTSLAEFRVGLGTTAAAEGTAAGATTGMTGALGGLRAGLLTTTTAGLGLAGAIALIGLGTSEAIGGQKRHAEHIRAVSVEEQKLTAALNAGKISLRDVTSAAGGNQAALKKVAAAAGIAVDVTEKFTPDTWHLREALAAVGKTAPKTPNAITATGDAAAAAAPHIRSAADVLDYYARIAASVKAVRFLGGIPGHTQRAHRAQHGGFYRGLTLVGEEGPELVNFGRSGAYVHTNTQTRAMETVIPSGAASAGSSISGDIILQVGERELGRISRDALLKLKPSRVNLGLA